MITGMDAADLVRGLRIRTGLSVRALARAAAVSPASVDRIEHRRVAPTATLERILHSLGYRLEVRAAPAREVPLTREDRRSLAYHRLIAIKLLDDSASVRAKARSNMAVLRRADESGRSSRYLDEWDRLLDGADHELTGVLLDPSEHARDLRQTSPFAGVLTPVERSRIYPTRGAVHAT